MRKTQRSIVTQCCKAALLASSLAVISAPSLAADNVSDLELVQSHYSIAAGKLASVLNQFAQQANITLSFTPEQLQGLKSVGLNDKYSTDNALKNYCPVRV